VSTALPIQANLPLPFSIPIHNYLTVSVFRVPGYRSRGPGFDSRSYQILWEVVGLERGPLCLVNTTEELLQWKSSGFGSSKSILTAVGSWHVHHATPLYPQKLALTSPTCGGRSVCIIRLWTKAMEFSFQFITTWYHRQWQNGKH
jgi:hypothetical protein